MVRKYESMDKKAKSAAESAGSVVIEQPKSFMVALEVVGLAALIQNNFSQKAMEQMLRKHMGLSVQREAKVPAKCIEDATIRNVAEQVCIPPTAFKKAILTASTQTKGLRKTQLRTQLYIDGQSIPIKYKEMIPRLDMVRTSGMTRTPDVRFRPMFTDWSARIVITFADTIAVQTVVDLLNRAGKVGVGEWRPEKDGVFGTFVVARHIDDPQELAEVREACSAALRPLVIPEWAMNAEISPQLLARIAGGKDDESEDAEQPEDA